MSKETLVAYASRLGATHGVAEDLQPRAYLYVGAVGEKDGRRERPVKRPRGGKKGARRR